MITIHVHFLRDQYAELRAGLCSIRDARDILMMSK